MKRIMAMLLAALLCAACAMAEPVNTLDNNYDPLQGTDLFYAKEQTGYALTDMWGNRLTEAVYTNNFRLESGWISARKTTGEAGLLSASGEAVIPFQYDEVQVIGEKWGLGTNLKTTDSEKDYDYSSIGGKRYVMDGIDLYYLPEARLVATLAREHYMKAAAFDQWINIIDRETGAVTGYDASFSVVAENLRQYNSFEYAPSALEKFEDGGYGLRDGLGNVLIQPEWSHISWGTNDWPSDSVYVESDGRKGLCDYAGNIIAPAQYDEIMHAKNLPATVSQGTRYLAGGYVCVGKDGKLGYAKDGAETCAPKYSADEAVNNGMSALLSDGGFRIIAADGTETVLEGVTEVKAIVYGSGRYYEVEGEMGCGIVDWHGEEILPAKYIQVFITGSGRYALAKAEGGVWEIHALEGEDYAGMLKSAAELLKSDPAANSEAARVLLDRAARSVPGSEAAKVLGSAIALLEMDPAANAEAAIVLIDSAAVQN